MKSELNGVVGEGVLTEHEQRGVNSTFYCDNALLTRTWHKNFMMLQLMVTSLGISKSWI